MPILSDFFHNKAKLNKYLFLDVIIAKRKYSIISFKLLPPSKNYYCTIQGTFGGVTVSKLD